MRGCCSTQFSLRMRSHPQGPAPGRNWGPCSGLRRRRYRTALRLETTQCPAQSGQGSLRAGHSLSSHPHPNIAATLSAWRRALSSSLVAGVGELGLGAQTITGQWAQRGPRGAGVARGWGWRGQVGDREVLAGKSPLATVYKLSIVSVCVSLKVRV